MTWYRTGTVSVTNGSVNVTLAGGDALQNIFPDDGFWGPDGKLYAIATIGGAGSFTLQTAYQGSTASGQAYRIVPVADYVQLRDALAAMNTLITNYQDIAVKAGVGLFANGSVAAPGVRGIGHEGTGLVWNGDGSITVSVNGSAVTTFLAAGGMNSILKAPDGSASAPSMTFASDPDNGFFRAANNTVGFAASGVEAMRFSATGLQIGLASTPTFALGVYQSNAASRTVGYFENSAAADAFLSLKGGDCLGFVRAYGSTYSVSGLRNSAGIGADTGKNVSLVPGTGGESIICAGAFGTEVGRFNASNQLMMASWGTASTPVIAIGGHQNGFYNDTSTRIGVAIQGARVARFDPTFLIPGTDNTQDLGIAGFRWKTIYATTGTINTSDERLKTWRGEMSPSEITAAVEIVDEFGFYQWNDAVEKKGDDARYHFGARAQRVWAIMAKHGLIDPITDGKPGDTPYAFLCYDEWSEEREPITETKIIPAKYKGRGKNRVEIEPERTEIVDTGKTRVSVEAGDRFGLRPDMLNSFMVAGLNAKRKEQDQMIADLYTRLNAIEARILNDGK